MNEQKPNETKLSAEQRLPPGQYTVQMDAEILLVISKDGRLMNSEYPLACSQLWSLLNQAATHEPSQRPVISVFYKLIPESGDTVANSKTQCPTCGSEVESSKITSQN